MFAGKFDLPHAFQVIDMKHVHVDYPSHHILLCGGRFAYDDLQPNRSMLSLRDTFHANCHRAPFSDYEIIFPENVSKQYQARLDTYENLLSLESDLAQISSIILLFSESYGSAAELGAFCWDEDINKRLLVIISDKYYEETSFVKLGPLQHLKSRSGEESVCVIPENICNIDRINCKTDSTKIRTIEYMVDAFRNRLKKIDTLTTLNTNHNGHIILFLVGIVWYYHALEKDELYYLAMELFGNDFPESRIQRAMFCASIFGWIIPKSAGSRQFYVSINDKNSLEFRRKDKSLSLIDWKVNILDFWRREDRVRFDAIRGAR